MTDMPGTIQNAAPSTVLPQSFCRAFVHERVYAKIENEYRNGGVAAAVLATNSRMRCRLVKRLTPAALQALRNFYDAPNGANDSGRR
jgi:hypothetical protein